MNVYLRLIFRLIRTRAFASGVGLSALAVVLGSLFLGREGFLRTSLQSKDASVFLVFAAAAVGVLGFIPLLLSYLRTPQDRDLTESWRVERGLAESRDLLDRTRKEVEKFQELVLSRTSSDQAIDTSALVAELRATLKANVAEDLRKDFEKQISTLAHVELIRSMYKYDERRLFDQIAILRKRGNLNLVIGIATTLVAAMTLILTVVFASPNGTQWEKLLAYFIPKISTVVFVEVFSFFFLRLYKATLAEEKYYQNEITARTARQTALEAAFGTSDTVAMGKLIELLAGVNQNRFDVKDGNETGYDSKDIGTLVESAAKVISSVAQKSHGAG